MGFRICFFLIISFLASNCSSYISNPHPLLPSAWSWRTSPSLLSPLSLSSSSSLPSLRDSHYKRGNKSRLLLPRALPTYFLDKTRLYAQNEIDAVTNEYEEALKKTSLWVGLAVAFGISLFFVLGRTACEEFFAGYLVEQSLSVDNLFVFLLLFEYFRVPKELEGKILNWGIFGAMGMRAVMIGVGTVALKEFRGILLVFAGILVYSSCKLLYEFISGDGDSDDDMGENEIVKFSRGLFPSTDKYDGSNFFTKNDLGRTVVTPLFLSMVALEISDVVFAVDSIPAVFGVTENPLIVFTSNIFAIMGLRSLYTVLSSAVESLKYLEPAVAGVLGFIGVKLIAEYGGIEVPTEFSLGVVAAVLGLGVGVSLAFPEDDNISSDDTGNGEGDGDGDGDGY